MTRETVENSQCARFGGSALLKQRWLGSSGHSSLWRKTEFRHLDLDDVVLDGVHDQIADGVQIELSHDVATMHFHGLGAQVGDPATSLEVFPSARSWVTSRSRAVSVGPCGPWLIFNACPFPRKPANTRSFTRGVKNIRLFCKASTAARRMRRELHRT